MKTSKKRIALGRHCFFACVLVCCFFLAKVCLAKMINDTPVERDGSVHIAEWSVDVSSSDSNSMTLDAGSNSQTYSLVVTNNSEITSTYSIKVSNIPAGVKIGLDIASESDLVTPVNGEVVFTNTGNDLSYESPNNTRTHTLTLKAEATANITQSAVNMSIEVLFVQKEPQP